jgi:hypothetical protein
MNRWVEKAGNHNMTGKVVGASEDGAQLAVLWSDNVLRIERADDLTDYTPTKTPMAGLPAETEGTS